MTDDVVSGGNGRPVQVRTRRKDGWTRARRAKFLDHLAATANVTRSAAAAGMDHRNVYYLRRRDPAFAQLWREALLAGYERLEAELLARAMNRSGEGAVNAIEPGESGEVVVPDIDVDLGLKMLAQHKRAEAGYVARKSGPRPKQVTPEETDKAIMKQLAALARRLKVAD